MSMSLSAEDRIVVPANRNEPPAAPLPPETRPLVTFFVMGHNAEDGIHHGIESAFAQDYAPLEIILSDDGSQDGTFAVMERMAAAYDGPHTVRLNRRVQNGGVVAHLTDVMAQAQGEILVQHNADDISAPNRVSRIVAAWRASGGRATGFHSAMRRIDLEGRDLGPVRVNPSLIADPSPANIAANIRYMTGAAAAWSKRLYEAYGGFEDFLYVEDNVIPFRAATLGPIVYIDDPLVQFRAGGNSWRADPRDLPGHEMLYGYSQRFLKNQYTSQRQILVDLDRIEMPDKEATRRVVAANVARLGFAYGLSEASHAGRLARLPGALGQTLRHRNGWYLKTALKYLFDRPYILFYDWRRARRQRRRGGRHAA